MLKGENVCLRPRRHDIEIYSILRNEVRESE